MVHTPTIFLAPEMLHDLGWAFLVGACPVPVNTGFNGSILAVLSPSVSTYPGHVLTGFSAHKDHAHQAAMACQESYCFWLLEGESHTPGLRCNAHCSSLGISPSLQGQEAMSGSLSGSPFLSFVAVFLASSLWVGSRWSC